MTDDERKQIIQLIFTEIRADHTPDGLKVAFMPRAAWARYVEAVLAKQEEGAAASARYHIGSPDGIRTHDLFLERKRLQRSDLGRREL
ncbi:MAG TPA: hypothetical protein VIN74_11115 [Candidatus Limnocylindria bacterium]